ncbi:hypothetical protein P43SY_008524 [Pythium insidiosum]|uniref:ABC transporter domain-containing protein n=1 Tax=Pythium insidiosum TaxID=114742 RepID=A0AAD5MBK8_PYTIN|nr:hypothetical protein P43SY_008524 [Pythium insidiosum]
MTHDDGGEPAAGDGALDATVNDTELPRDVADARPRPAQVVDSSVLEGRRHHLGSLTEEMLDVVPDLLQPDGRHRSASALISTTSVLRQKSMTLERYSSLDTSNLETMLSGGLDRFYHKYKTAWKKHNLSFPTPEIVFEDLSYSVRISTEPSASKGSIGGFIRAVVRPWRKLKTVKKPILHTMSGIIRPGNIILPQLIPDYWIWMHWFNPVAWALRALLLIEFHDKRHSIETQTAFLQRFQVTEGPEFVWIAVIILIFYYILFTLLNTLALQFIRYEVQATAASSPGMAEETYPECAKPPATTSITDSIAVPEKATGSEDTSILQGVDITSKNVVIEMAEATAPAQNDTASSNITSTAIIPAYLAVRNLSYFVPNPAGGAELQLLHNVSVHFTPGKMTALMGSSGAGKTTLMDVLAGRKTGGRITGEILVNGEPKNPVTFSRIAGYVEQMDIHSGGATIEEALQFSARLRLPSGMTESARSENVKNVMDLLELHPIAHDLIHNCSIEQKKRITIGVEVVANPSILFLDEPTSGLDARSASLVMKGVLSIARTGRTVLCTIHQPSTQIFEMFDSLLLLQKGGYIAFFGDLGIGSERLVNYFQSIPDTRPMPARYNPATYMLEVIGAGIGRGQARDYSVEYVQSSLCAANMQITSALAQGVIPSEISCSTPTVLGIGATGETQPMMVRFSTLGLTPMATGLSVQLRACGAKMRLLYWRCPQYNLMRLVSFPVYAVIFGTTFYQLKQTAPAAVNSHVGLMYNTLDFIGVINLMTVLDIVTSERAVYYRERMSNYYGALPYAVSLYFAELPYLVLTSFIFMNVEYWLVGWNADASSFFLYWFIFFLHVSICTSIGQLMCVLLPNIKVANVAAGALSVIFNLYAGFLMPHIDMKAFYRWVRYLVPTKYSLESLVGIEMGRCDAARPTHGCLIVSIPGANGAPATTMELHAFIKSNYGFEYNDIWTNMAVLIGIWMLLQVAIYLTLRFVSHLKR